MTAGTSYNYSQRGDMVVNRNAGTTRHQPTNFRRFKAIKGVDTRIVFYIKDDRAPMQLHDVTITASIAKVDGSEIVLTKTLEVVDATIGMAATSITASNISEIDAGLYQMVLTYQDSTGSTRALFVDQNYRAEYTLEILDNVIPQTAASQEFEGTDAFTSTDNVTNPNEAVTSKVPGGADTTVWGLHTVAIHGTGATGTVRVQGSLAESPTERDFFDIILDPIAGVAQLELTDFTGIDSYIFEGNLLWVRFITDISQGTVDKIQYRH
jgi:hypothetical protein